MTEPGSSGRASARCTLLLVPGEDDVASGACLEAVTGTEPRERDVIVVSHGREPESIVDAWSKHVSVLPDNFGIVSVGDSMRSTTGVVADEADRARNFVRTVADSEDLTGTRDRIGEFVEEWNSTGNESIVYFDSVTTFVRAAGVEHVIDLVEDVSGLLAVHGCAGYFRYDVCDSDDNASSRLEQAFDRVDRITGTGSASPQDGEGELTGHTCRSLPMDDVFEVLSVRRRRVLLRRLLRSEDLTTIRELAEGIVEEECGSVTSEELTRAYVALRHVHLPKLEDARIVSVDRTRNVVEPMGNVLERLEPVLEFAAKEDP